MNKIFWVGVAISFISFWAGYMFAALTIAAKKGDDASGSPTHNVIKSSERPDSEAEE